MHVLHIWGVIFVPPIVSTKVTPPLQKSVETRVFKYFFQFLVNQLEDSSGCVK